jgi:hypothetical protein
MTVLHLGVLDVPYADGKVTTGEVATILEDKYHVIELFAEEMGADAIGEALAHSAKAAVEDLMSGAPQSSVHLTFEATEEIATAFRVFIDQKELDGVVPGVPTAASLKGVNHRLKRPYAKANPIRPSFKDTGVYENSFRAWTDD